MLRKKRVAFDCDGPLAHDKTPDFFLYVNHSRGYHWDYLKYVETGDWELAAPGFTHEQRDALYQEFRQHRLCGDIPTIGACAAIRAMNGVDKFLVTTRAPDYRGPTMAFVQEHFGYFRDYHFGVSSKVYVLNELCVDYFIDDNLYEALLAAEMGTFQVFLFPIRGFQRIIKKPNLVILEAEKHNSPGISDDEWGSVCHHAWQEIVQNIASPLAT